MLLCQPPPPRLVNLTLPPTAPVVFQDEENTQIRPAQLTLSLQCIPSGCLLNKQIKYNHWGTQINEWVCFSAPRYQCPLDKFWNIYIFYNIWNQNGSSSLMRNNYCPVVLPAPMIWISCLVSLFGSVMVKTVKCPLPLAFKCVQLNSRVSVRYRLWQCGNLRSHSLSLAGDNITCLKLCWCPRANYFWSPYLMVLNNPSSFSRHVMSQHMM